MKCKKCKNNYSKPTTKFCADLIDLEINIIRKEPIEIECHTCEFRYYKEIEDEKDNKK